MVHSLFQLTQKFFQTFILWISNSKLNLRQLFLSFLCWMKWKIPIYYIEFELFFYRIKNIAFQNHQSFSLEFLQINLILIRFYVDQSILNSLLINISTKNNVKFIAFIQQNLNYSTTTSCTNLEIFFIFKIFNLQLINVFNELINKPFCSQENRRRKYVSHNLIDSFVDNSLMFSQFLVLFQFVICSLLNLIIHVILIQQKHFNSSIIKLIFTLINHQTHTFSQMSTAQKIAQIQAEMERTQKNKATSYHVGLLKAKLAKLKRQLIEPPGGKKGTAGQGFQVSKSGDARVGMIGFPSVGKSTLLTKLTGTFSKIAAYQFTTLTCVPGVLMHKGAKIQLLDLPGIIEGAKDGKGRGRQVIAVARTCNLIVIVLDATRPMGHKKIIEHQLQGFGIRLNKSPPQIDFKKKDKGGIIISRMVDTDKVSDQTIKAILKQYKINNADICLKCDATEDDIIDIIEGNRKYIPCLYALNKIDAITLDQLNILDQIQHYVPIAGDLGWNLDQLVQRMWEYLDLIRVYTKPKGKDPDYSMPVILPRTHSLIEDFCLRIHRNMIKDFRYAMVWGTSVKFNPQKVGKDHNLLDQDVVQIIKKI